MKTEHEALHSLQQRIVQFACDARPFAHTLLQSDREQSRDLAHAQQIEHHGDGDYEHGDESFEPPRVPPRRRDRNVDRAARLTPRSARRRCLKPKAIVARR